MSDLGEEVAKEVFKKNNLNNVATFLGGISGGIATLALAAFIGYASSEYFSQYQNITQEAQNLRNISGAGISTLVLIIAPIFIPPIRLRRTPITKGMIWGSYLFNKVYELYNKYK